MRHLILASLILLSLGTLPAAAAVATTFGSVTTIDFVPGEMPPTLHCSPLNHCLVVFPPKTVIGKVLLPDSYRWILDAVEADGRPILAITPRHCELRTRITIPTATDLFDFPLESVCETADKDINPTGPATKLVIHAVAASDTGLDQALAALDSQAPPPPGPPLIPTDHLIAARIAVKHADEAPPVIYQDEQGRTVIQFTAPPQRAPILGVVVHRRFQPLADAQYDPIHQRILISRPVGERWVILLDSPARTLRKTARFEIRRPRR